MSLAAHLLRASSSPSVLAPRSPLASARAHVYVHIARLSCDLAIRDTGVTTREPIVLLSFISLPPLSSVLRSVRRKRLRRFTRILPHRFAASPNTVPRKTHVFA